ncbi:hypothetical protein [Pseudodonghicola xiamenensis]|uniref:Tetratricopeptide repeat-containing protein n=1 Tax=Pseudodonghicola xiamenensis TaxID=337702 RepID=A0A8J3MBS3_9RHOB|nr:hypothetical protein [Pseudodonghicola xiamenensis]GHG80499.1 hypothetical protein GCM10010961_03690 [Pseudodonghicola xiamenensis]
MRINPALFAVFWPATALAQDPLSVIDWLGAAYQAPTVRGSVLLEPPVAKAALRPEIEVSPLEDAPVATGLVAPATTGLPVDLWRGSDPRQLVRLISEAPVQDSPAMQALFYTLLLAEKLPPEGAGPKEARQLMLAQIDRLISLGAVDAALALVEQAGPTRDAAFFRRWFDAALLSGEEDRPCAALLAAPYLAPDYAALIFCTAREGDWQTAALTLETVRSLALLPEAQVDLLDRFLNPEFFDGAPPLPAPDAPDPLTFRLYEAIGERLPSSNLPRAFANADLRDLAGWKAQIEAAERLTRIGALNPNRLLGLYTDRRPAASGGVWDRVAAVQRFDTALSTGSAEAVAKTLPRAWEQMRIAGLEVPFAHMFTDRLSALRLDGKAAALAWQIELLSPTYEGFSHRPPDNSAERTFLAALAQGDPGRADPPDELARAIAHGFSDDTRLPQDLADALQAQRLGEVILRAIALFDHGARGNPTELTTALATFRAVGLEDTARRAALQLLLIGAV